MADEFDDVEEFDEFDEFQEFDESDEIEELEELEETEETEEFDEYSLFGGVGGPLNIELAVESLEEVLVLSPHAVNSKNADETMSVYNIKFFISFSRKVYIVVIPL